MSYPVQAHSQLFNIAHCMCLYSKLRLRMGTRLDESCAQYPTIYNNYDYVNAYQLRRIELQKDT